MPASAATSEVWQRSGPYLKVISFRLLMSEAHRLYLSGYTGHETKQPLQQELETLLAEEEADQKQQRIDQEREEQKEQTDTLTGHGWFGNNVASADVPSVFDPTYTDSQLVARNRRARRQQRIAEIRRELERQEMETLVQEQMLLIKKDKAREIAQARVQAETNPTLTGELAAGLEVPRING